VQRQVIIHECSICKSKGVPMPRTDCYDSDRAGTKKLFCVDPFTSKSCRQICPVPTQDIGSSFCEEHKIWKLKQMREENQREKDND